MIKNPFMRASLEELSNNNEIKEIIEKNNCKSILYFYVTDKTNLNDYDFIIIRNKVELSNIADNDIEIFNNYKKKLFYVCEYIDFNLNYFRNIYLIYNNINLALDIYFTKSSNIILTNLVINISLNDNKFINTYQHPCEKKIKTTILLNYLNSSISQLFINFDEHNTIESPKNLPNKIKIFNIELIYFWKKITKLPKNIILIQTANNKHYDLKKNLLKSQLNCILSNTLNNNRLSFIINYTTHFNTDGINKMSKTITEVNNENIIIGSNNYKQIDKNYEFSKKSYDYYEINYLWKIILCKHKYFYCSTSTILSKIIENKAASIKEIIEIITSPPSNQE